MRGFWRKANRLVLAAALCLPALAPGQRPGRPGVAEVPELTPAQARERLEAFRMQRLAGDYVLYFDLVHLPRRGEEREWTGILWGTWTPAGPRTRILIQESQAGGLMKAPLQLLVQGGPEPRVWKLERRDEVERLTGEALRMPVLEGIEYTPFELVMPFNWWEDYEYAGPARVLGWPAQRFRMAAPDGGAGMAPDVASVLLTLHDDYNALMRAEAIGAAGEPLRSFRIRSFQKIGEQYIVKTIDFVDEQSGDKTRFEVTAAAVGLNLPDGVFEPGKLERYPPPLDPALIERL